MLSFKIVWTEFAEWNLHEIYRYLFSKSKSEKIAKNYILNLVLRVEQLEKFPDSGHKEEALLEMGKDFRFLVYKNYKIVYFVSEATVYVTDVFHTKLDPTKLKKRSK